MVRQYSRELSPVFDVKAFGSTLYHVADTDVSPLLFLNGV
jgi:hypothetical protein